MSSLNSGARDRSQFPFPLLAANFTPYMADTEAAANKYIVDSGVLQILQVRVRSVYGLAS